MNGIYNLDRSSNTCRGALSEFTETFRKLGWSAPTQQVAFGRLSFGSFWIADKHTQIVSA